MRGSDKQRGLSKFLVPSASCRAARCEIRTAANAKALYLQDGSGVNPKHEPKTKKVHMNSAPEMTVINSIGINLFNTEEASDPACAFAICCSTHAIGFQLWDERT